MSFAPIAIVGRGCVLPGADDPAALWRAVAAGRDLVDRAPAGRWRLEPAAECSLVAARRLPVAQFRIASALVSTLYSNRPGTSLSTIDTTAVPSNVIVPVTVAFGPCSVSVTSPTGYC